MKILHVTREKAADRGYGLGKSLLPVVSALQAQGHEARYICQADLAKNESDELNLTRDWWASKFTRLPARFGNVTSVVDIVVERLTMGRYAAKFAAEMGATHVHLHDPWIAEGFRRHANKVPGVLWGLTEHGFGSYAQAAKDEGIGIGRRLMQFLLTWERRILARAHWLVLPSDSSRLQLTRDFTLFQTPSHWHTVPHARPEQSLRSREAARALLGWLPNERHVVGVGRFAVMKRFPMLIEACAELAERHNLRLTILGDGDPAPLLDAAKYRSFENRLTLQATEDVGLYLSAADLYVSTSSTESFGMANLEAMVAGLPVVCAVGGATADVIGIGGWLVPGNLESITSAMDSILSDPSIDSFWRAQAHARGAAWPDASTIAQCYVNIYSLASTQSH